MKIKTEETKNLPPFTRTLLDRIRHPHIPFDTPGHHGGQFYRLTPEGRVFTKLLGDAPFLTDISDSDDELGDPSSHDGIAGMAETLASQVFHADRTWFVLHGTSVSNRICAEALLSPGDLVLFDRNNHKSLYQGALLKCDTRAVYLEPERLKSGIIGGIQTENLTRTSLRNQVAHMYPEKRNKRHPFRLACLESVTYDGLIADPAYFIRLLSPLCDYILFDSAWGGYESFLPLLSSYDPLQYQVTSRTAGILVTQSVHKQLAGFSQTSQIHKKDDHIKNKKYYLSDDILDNSFLMNISTSPYFPFFAALEMNAFLHQKYGQILWHNCAIDAVELRKDIITSCQHIRPFLPPTIKGKPWHTFDSETILKHRKFWSYHHQRKEVGIKEKNEHYIIDPCKILLTTNEGTRKIPASVLSQYLQTQNITPEKCGLHSILFLAEPGDNDAKRHALVKALSDFETHIWNQPVTEIFPHTEKTYLGTVGDLCNAIESLITRLHGEHLEKELFTHSPITSFMNGKQANDALIRGKYTLLPLDHLQDRIALECAMIYPPGICAVTAGEIWTNTAMRYFRFIETYMNQFPDFAPHTVGLHIKIQNEQKKLYARVFPKKQSSHQNKK